MTASAKLFADICPLCERLDMMSLYQSIFVKNLIQYHLL